jgi:hypothetical protein
MTKCAIVFFVDFAAARISEAHIAPFITSSNFKGEKVLSLYTTSFTYNGKDYDICINVSNSIKETKPNAPTAHKKSA